MRPRKRVEVIVFASVVAGILRVGLSPKQAKTQAVLAAIGRRPFVQPAGAA